MKDSKIYDMGFSSTPTSRARLKLIPIRLYLISDKNKNKLITRHRSNGLLNLKTELKYITA